MLSDKRQPIGIRELIEQLKSELRAEYETDHPMFAIGEVEVTVAFEVERNAEGGVDFKVLQAGVAKTMSDVQQITIKLEPLVTPEDHREQLSDEQKQQASHGTLRSDSSNPTRGG